MTIRYAAPRFLLSPNRRVNRMRERFWNLAQRFFSTTPRSVPVESFRNGNGHKAGWKKNVFSLFGEKRMPPDVPCSHSRDILPKIPR